MPIGDAMQLAAIAATVMTGWIALVTLAGCKTEEGTLDRIDVRAFAAAIATGVIVLSGAFGGCVGFHQGVAVEQQRAAPAPAEKGTP